jgi:hypothetical protein
MVVLSPCHRPIISILALTLFFASYLRLDLRKAALKRSDEMTEMSALIRGGVGDRNVQRKEISREGFVLIVAERTLRKVPSINEARVARVLTCWNRVHCALHFDVSL